MKNRDLKSISVIISLLIAFSVVSFDAIWIKKTLIDPAKEASLRSISFPDNAISVDEMKEKYSPVFYTEHDGYPIVKNALLMAEEGSFRIRKVQWDNAPFGRPERRGSIFHWWLVFLGRVHSIFSGDPLASSIISISYYANTVLFFCALIVLAVILFRTLGGIAAAVIIPILSTHKIIQYYFAYANPDHHGLQLVLVMGTLLCLIIGGGGWVEEAGSFSSYGQAKKWFIASGIFGGLGLWESGIQHTVLISSLGISALISLYFLKDPLGIPVKYKPQLWRVWSMVGASVSLMGYFIEYFPNDLDFRVEFNHPLYALSWFCGGEIIYRLGLIRQGKISFSALELLRILFYLFGVIFLYWAILFGPIDWFAVRDAYITNLYSFTDELQPYHKLVGTFSFLNIFRLFAILLLPSLFFIFALFSPSYGKKEKSLFILMIVPVTVFFIFFLAQNRWAGFFSITAITTVSLFFLKSDKNSLLFQKLPVSIRVFFIAVLFANLSVYANDLYSGIKVFDTTTLEMSYTDVHHLALNIEYYNKKSEGKDTINIMTGPLENNSFHFYCSCRVTGSYYWENIEGIHDMIDFFSSYSIEESYSILKKRNIDYILIQAGVNQAAFMHYYKYKRTDRKSVMNTVGFKLANSLFDREIPWVQPLPIYGYPTTKNWKLFKVLRNN